MVPVRVSVIVRTYNRAGLIAETLQSVLAQTIGDLEIIVVDDGSTDGTAEVVRRCADGRIRYLYQENRGQSAAANTGVLASAAEYVAILDSDDVWLPGMLETAVSALDARPDAGLFYARSSTIDRSGRPCTQMLGVPPKFPGQAFRSLLYGDPIAPGTVVVRRACFEKAGLFDEALNGTEDWDMWLRIAEHYPVIYVDRVLAHYRYHQSNYTGVPKHYDHLTSVRVRVLDKVYSGRDLPQEARDVRALAYRNVYMDVGLRWLSVRGWRKCAAYFWRAVRVSPQPLVTPFRILFLILFYNGLSKTAWGSRLVAMLAWRRQASRGLEGSR